MRLATLPTTRGASWIRELDWGQPVTRSFLGAYFLVLGASLVLLPATSVDGTTADDWPRGLATAASGLALLWLGVLRPRRPWWRAAHVAAGLPQVASGVGMVAAGSISPGFVLIAFGLLAATLSIRDGDERVGTRGDILTHALLAVAFVQGAAMSMAADPTAVLVGRTGIPPVAWGAALAGGAGLASALLLLRRSPRLVAACIGLVVVLQVAQVAIGVLTISPTLLLLGAASYLRIAALAGYRVRERFALDWRSAEVALAVAMLTATVVPVLLVLATNHALGIVAEDVAVRQLQYGIVSFAVLLAFAVAWTGGRALAGPVRRLAARVRALGLEPAASEPELHAARYSELDDLVDALTATRTALAVEHARTTSLIAQLEDANRVKDEFLGLVSHELKTPVTTIVGSGALLARSADPAVADLGQGVVSDGERLAAIIDNLLVLARLEAGKRPEIEPVLLVPAVQSAIDATRRQSGAPLITLVSGPVPAIVDANGDQVQMVARNLLANAVKYGGGAPIEVRIVVSGARATVSVVDGGPGLSDADRERVFQPFFRAARTAQTAPGMGIGLAVCRRVVEAMGGECWVEPRQDGPGSVFSFSLLLAETDGLEEEAWSMAANADTLASSADGATTR